MFENGIWLMLQVIWLCSSVVVSSDFVCIFLSKEFFYCLCNLYENWVLSSGVRVFSPFRFLDINLNAQVFDELWLNPLVLVSMISMIYDWIPWFYGFDDFDDSGLYSFKQLSLWLNPLVRWFRWFWWFWFLFL